MCQRVEMATRLINDVAHDLESGDVDFETPGLAELNKAVKTLAERMSRVVPALIALRIYVVVAHRLVTPATRWSNIFSRLPEWDSQSIPNAGKIRTCSGG